uniref:Cystatin F n=1 Tax=Esox lucius TaxID=8010 RepID=A0A3P8YLY6_ESOLU
MQQKVALHDMNCQRYTFIPGAPHEISRNDSGVLKAALHGTYSFNNKTNDAFLFKPSAIEKAERQIVKGFNYIMEVDISRTVCHKNGQNNTDLARCVFQPDGLLKQTFHCHFEVWTIPWLNFMKTIDLACSPSEKNITSP